MTNFYAQETQKTLIIIATAIAAETSFHCQPSIIIFLNPNSGVFSCGREEILLISES